MAITAFTPAMASDSTNPTPEGAKEETHEIEIEKVDASGSRIGGHVGPDGRPGHGGYDGRKEVG
ncbi:hypothetical protein DSCA_41820 [Desulfosarcina alkanivorans]|uniref:Uncharacterized protein n=1 Tax=Desulfosarcina alkanivorans TaxID=571177 RepID=A0A5K7YKK8_9BACT|nr:hypothetical protein DSCA_41820 [Desulfosarcina alkanivorans]